MLKGRTEVVAEPQAVREATLSLWEDHSSRQQMMARYFREKEGIPTSSPRQGVLLKKPVGDRKSLQIAASPSSSREKTKVACKAS